MDKWYQRSTRNRVRSTGDKRKNQIDRPCFKGSLENDLLTHGEDTEQP